MMNEEKPMTYTFTHQGLLEYGYSFEKFNNIVTTKLKEKLLNDNIFILKNANNLDYIEDIIPQNLRKLEIKEEEFLQQLINKYELIVDHAVTHVKAEFLVSPKNQSIYSSFYKESFILTPNFKAPENDLLVNEINNFVEKQSALFNGIEQNFYQNEQTLQAKLSINCRINAVHTTFPISKFF